MSNIHSGSFTLARRVASLGLAALLILASCSSIHRPYDFDPDELSAPYAAERELTWVVVPIRNESGVSVADELRLTDALVATLQEANGLTVLPLNRTLEAMRAAGLPQIDSAAHATHLARRMNADAVIVGALTAWDPYEPPKVGISLSLYARSDTMGVFDLSGLDPRQLAMASSDRDPWDVRSDPSRALSSIALHIDGANGEVRAALERYASGRIDPNAATGWKGYLTVMRRFERFACFYASEALLRAERDRLIAQAAELKARKSAAQAERDQRDSQLNTVGAKRALTGVHGGT